MLRCPGVPLLPGTVFHDVSKTRFPRTQKFMSLNGINMLSDRKHPCYGGNEVFDLNCPPYELPSLYPPKTGPKLPPWLAHDKKILCFHGYFKQTLQEVYLAPYQVRKVKIYYYLEDGTMKIVEPPVLNSGIPQGCLVARQRVPRPPPCQNEFISVLDLNVNQTIRIFDRVYYITDCDLFTRNFLNRAGIPVSDPADMPEDPSTELRKKTLTKPKHAPTHFNTFAQFLKFDRNVLKFTAYWNDRSEFGDVRNFEVCYFLADDTIEIKEIFPVNSGRDGPAVFLKRQKLQKEWSGLPLPGEQADVTILNVLGGGLRTGRYIADPLGVGSRKITYYKDCDLQIGTHLNVFGRDFILTDCDGFTKDFYRKKYGVETFTPISHPWRPVHIDIHPKSRELPPWNGWGSHEDSEGNCISVEPKPPHTDLKKFIHLDRFVLRFGAKMFSRIKENCERIFIISYYLSDDTIQIFEIAERNSGFLGGEFLKRARILLPNQNLFTSNRPEYYKPHQFYIGATLNITDHMFHIISADEYTLMYMEQHPFEFPFADVETIIAKLREALRPDYKNFISKYIDSVCKLENNRTSLAISFETLRTALIDLLGNNITDHEIITVGRYFSALKAPTEKCEREKVRAAVHLEIRRALWDALDRLKEHLYHIEPNGTGFLSEPKIRSTILACRLPFSKDLIDDLISVLIKNPYCEIDVCDFINFLDVTHNPAPAIAPMNIAFELCPKIVFEQKGCLIDWNRLLETIGLEEQIKQETE